MRYGVAIRVDGIAFIIVDEIAFIIALLNRGHDDDTIAVLYSFIVLFHFKEIRTEGESLVVLVELRIFRVVVDALHLTIAIVVREDEDDAPIVAGIHRAEVEVSVVMDD
jgi:hypothetical protein